MIDCVAWISPDGDMIRFRRDSEGHRAVAKRILRRRDPAGVSQELIDNGWIRVESDWDPYTVEVRNWADLTQVARDVLIERAAAMGSETITVHLPRGSFTLDIRPRDNPRAQWPNPTRRDAEKEAEAQTLEIRYGAGVSGAEQEPLFDVRYDWRVDPAVTSYSVTEHPDARVVFADARQQWEDYLLADKASLILDHQRLASIDDAWQKGEQATLPPITVFETGRIFDGWHRLVVALGHGVQNVPAIVIRWT